MLYRRLQSKASKTMENGSAGSLYWKAAAGEIESEVATGIMFQSSVDIARITGVRVRDANGPVFEILEQKALLAYMNRDRTRPGSLVTTALERLVLPFYRTDLERFRNLRKISGIQEVEVIYSSVASAPVIKLTQQVPLPETAEEQAKLAAMPELRVVRAPQNFTGTNGELLSKGKSMKGNVEAIMLDTTNVTAARLRRRGIGELTRWDDECLEEEAEERRFVDAVNPQIIGIEMDEDGDGRGLCPAEDIELEMDLSGANTAAAYLIVER